MANVTSYSELIERLSALDPPVFVFGGFAEDAVLHGKVTRRHGDVDVLVVRDQLDVCTWLSFGRWASRPCVAITTSFQARH